MGKRVCCKAYWGIWLRKKLWSLCRSILRSSFAPEWIRKLDHYRQCDLTVQYCVLYRAVPINNVSNFSTKIYHTSIWYTKIQDISQQLWCFMLYFLWYSLVGLDPHQLSTNINVYTELYNTLKPKQSTIHQHTFPRVIVFQVFSKGTSSIVTRCNDLSTMSFLGILKERWKLYHFIAHDVRVGCEARLELLQYIPAIYHTAWQLRNNYSLFLNKW